MGNWYSILYRRVKQNDDVVIFIPVYYINGVYDKDDHSFIDGSGNLYFSNNEYEIITTAEEHTHFYPIHIDDLRNMYQSEFESGDEFEEVMVNLEECAGKYFGYFRNNILIGNVNCQMKIVELFNLSYEKWKELTMSQHYAIDGDEGKITMSKTTLESVLLESESATFSKRVNKWIENIESLEKMHNERRVERIEMSMDGAHIIGVGVTSTKVDHETKQAELEAVFAPVPTEASNSKTPNGILKYIKDRMVLPKDNYNIESILTQIIGNLEATCPEEINHVFSIGPTGTGKTYIYKLLGKILDVPVIIEDCNNIVQEGYVGTSIEDLIVKIYIQSGASVERAEKAIVYLDEMDKIASRGASVSDIGAQSSLLKFIEGSKYTVTVDKLRGTKVTIDTSMMSICAGGAFSDLVYDKRHIGFSSHTESEKKCPEFSDLIKYGMLPELIGRFSSFVYYDNYTAEEFKKVLLESMESPFLIKKNELARRFDVQLIATDDYFSALAHSAYEKKTGFRGIKLKISDSILPAQTKLQFSEQKYSQLVVSASTVENPHQYKLRRKNK